MATRTRSVLGPRRLLAGLGLVALVGVAACGDASEQQAEPQDTSAPSLPLIRAVPGAGGARLGAAEAMSSDAPVGMIWMPTEFVLVGDLPALDDAAGGWWFAPRSDLDPEAAARVVAALGLSGEPVPVAADWGGGWRVGPDDGSAPSVWFGADGLQSWWYQEAWQGQVRWGVVCEDRWLDDRWLDDEVETIVPPVDPEIEPSPGVIDPDVIDPDAIGPDEGGLPEGCVDLGPPVGVPTASEARDSAVAFLADLGMSADRYQLEVTADEWSAWVTVYDLLEGTRTGLVGGIGYGAEGAITYASGHMALPETRGPFPRVGTSEGFRRLQEGGAPWWWGGAARSYAEPAVADIMPIPGEEPDDLWEPEPVVVEIVDVRAELWQIYDVDGSVWLVPAYAFLDAEGMSYLVPAIPDDLVEVADVPVDPDTPVGDTPDGDDTTVDDPGTTEPMTLPTDDDAASLIGLTETEAVEAAAAQGWTIRVAEIDGEPLALTMDYREDRLNVTLVDGVVTAVSIG